MVVISELVRANDRFDFTNDQFYLALSYTELGDNKGVAATAHEGEDDKSLVLPPLSITPSMVSVLSAKRNGLYQRQQQQQDESSSYVSSVESDQFSNLSSCSVSSLSCDEEELVQQRPVAKRARSFNSSIVFPVIDDDHPLSMDDDDDDEDDSEDYLEFCYCDHDRVDLKKKTSIVEFAKTSLKKLSTLASSFSASTLRNQQAINMSTIKFNARMTDDKLPSQQYQEGTEMVTFKVVVDSTATTTASDKTTTTETSEMVVALKQRERESRINSRFLRIYAHDYSLKLKGELPFSDDELDYHLSNYHAIPAGERKDLVKMSLLAREKLWSNVVLAPRLDNICSLKEVCADVGVIKVGTEERYQYVKKGWVDQRWVSCV